MQIVRWKVIRKPLGKASEYDKRCMGIILKFAASKGIALEFVDCGTEEALALEAQADLGGTHVLYPVVLILQNDSAVGHKVEQPATEALQDLLDKFGKSDPTWGGRPAKNGANLNI